MGSVARGLKSPTDMEATELEVGGKAQQKDRGRARLLALLDPCAEQVRTATPLPKH